MNTVRAYAHRVVESSVATAVFDGVQLRIGREVYALTPGAFVHLRDQLNAITLPAVAPPKRPARDATPSDIAKIQEIVAAHYRVALDVLLGRRRPDCIALPRMVAMFLSHELTEHSLKRVGDAFLRDHGTVLNANATVRGRATGDIKLANDLATLRKTIRAALAGNSEVADPITHGNSAAGTTKEKQ